MMPTYEYECSDCGHRFERLQGMTETPVKTCPQCGKTVRRIIGSGPAIVMKRGAARPGGASCSFESTGKTCCGQDEKCGKPCGGDK